MLIQHIGNIRDVPVVDGFVRHPIMERDTRSATFGNIRLRFVLFVKIFTIINLSDQNSGKFYYFYYTDTKKKNMLC